ncbi:hypothetical protein D3C75_1353180 [compost metagenome]
MPMLKAAILIADATSTAVGTNRSANMTTYTCNPGTFIKARRPIRKTVIRPTSLNGAVKKKTKRTTAWTINI